MSSASPPVISSLVLTLKPGGESKTAALAALAEFPGLELGDYRQPWLPAVLESTAPQDACDQLRALPGVEFVEVTFVEVPTDSPMTDLPA